MNFTLWLVVCVIKGVGAGEGFGRLVNVFHFFLTCRLWRGWFKDVECLFGKVKNSKRMLLGTVQYHEPEQVEAIFWVAAVLHNMMLVHNGLDKFGSEDAHWKDVFLSDMAVEEEPGFVARGRGDVCYQRKTAALVKHFYNAWNVGADDRVLLKWRKTVEEFESSNGGKGSLSTCAAGARCSVCCDQ
jgi:hypothetical protein